MTEGNYLFDGQHNNSDYDEFNHISHIGEVASRTINEEGTYPFMSPSNHQTLAQMQLEDLLHDQHTTEEEEDE
jgi:hypothetical protein